MARLIIGAVTNTTALIWVRADSRYPYAFVSVGNLSKTVQTEERHGYTTSIQFTALNPNTTYAVTVAFASTSNAPSHRWVNFGSTSGSFVTAPDSGQNGNQVSFLLGSCNLHSLGSISSPDKAFEQLADRKIEYDSKFMIHCGDQIYYDIPNPSKSPDVVEYRKKYIDAWGDSRPTRSFLTQLPHYMIMDDHEITNDFDNSLTPGADRFRDLSMAVYREFVHIRQPNSYGRQALYYSFSWGNFEFFVLDCRTERYAANGQMIGPRQIQTLKRWLLDNQNSVKFVVTSIPFVGEVRRSEEKWSSPSFVKQKEELIDYIASNDIQKLIFLTGDMHNSYHASMNLENGNTLHELMSSPINQLQKSDTDAYELSSQHKTKTGLCYSSKILRSEFFSDNSNAMSILAEDNLVNWKIFRTKKQKVVKSGSFTV